MYKSNHLTLLSKPGRQWGVLLVTAHEQIFYHHITYYFYIWYF